MTEQGKCQMMESKVSIIIPVYNNEPYIEKCMESVRAQSYKQLEIIAIDDGSKDASGEILKRFAKEDSRIILIQQKNQGVALARNIGIRQATGEYITFIDGDDYIGKDYIYDMVKCAEENKAQMVVCGIKKVGENDTLLEEIIPGEYIRFEREEWVFRISAVAAHLYQRHMWDDYQVSFYPEGRGEDIPIALFFAGICENIVMLPQAEYYYVQHEKSAMHNFQGLKNYGLPYEALEQTIQKLQQIGIKNSVQFHQLFVLRILATFIQLAKGAGEEEIEKLADYIDYILDTYYPEYYKNPETGIFSKLDIPVFQKIAVKALIWAKRMKLLSVMLRVVC